uniref:uncharacterized protein isoform X1 n=1 Tax=Myxine glutinosa TaxID=7769 RepID=UPI00358F6F9C
MSGKRPVSTPSSTRGYCAEHNLDNKALLIVDNAPGHPPNTQELTDNVRVVFFPPNTPSLLQPMDQGIITMLKTYYLRGMMAHLVRMDRKDKPTLREFWKGYTIKNAVDNIAASWDEVTQANMNGVWRKLWPECVHDFRGFVNVPEIHPEIVGLAKEAGFDEVDLDDVVELLESHGEDLSNQDLIELEQQRARERQEEAESPTPPPKHFTTKRLAEIFHYIDHAKEIMMEDDPNMERSLHAKRALDDAVRCYKELYERKKREAIQTSLYTYFKPPSSSTSSHETPSTSGQTPETKSTTPTAASETPSATPASLLPTTQISQVMTDMETFPCCLQSQGLRPETAQAKVMELCIKSEEDMEEATDIAQNTRKSSIPIKELEVASTQKSSIASCIERDDKYSVKVECKQDNKDSTDWEALRCASVKEDQDDHRTNDTVACYTTGDIALVKVEHVQDDTDSSAPQALGCVSVKENSDDHHATNCSAPCFANGNNMGQVRSSHFLALNKIGVLKRQSQDQDSSPLQQQSSSHQHNAKVKIKLSLHTKVLKRQKCNVCNKNFASLSSMKRHMSIHTGDRPHECFDCGKGFLYKHTFDAHKLTHTGERPNKCSICGKGFSRKVTLKSHMRVHTEERPYKCSICDKNLRYKHTLKTHMMTHTGNYPYKCSVCGKGCSQKRNFKWHMRVHTGERPFKCSVCGKGFSRKDHLKLHMRVHTRECPDKCCVCGKKFSQKKCLKMHMRIHTGERPYKCIDCGKGFLYKHIFDAHKLTHTGERPHKCFECGKGFLYKRTLDVHKLTHTGERPYKCFDCGKGFRDKNTLDVHKFIHTGERPYKCSVCGKLYSRKIHLKLHMGGHTGERPYKCPVCGKNLGYKHTLKSHMMTHTGERPHKCSVCGKCFSRKGSLKMHMRVHTRDTKTKFHNLVHE